MRNFFRRRSSVSPASAEDGFLRNIERMIKRRVGSLARSAPLDQDPVWPRGIFYAPIFPPPTPPAHFDGESEAYRQRWEEGRGILASSAYAPLVSVFSAVDKLSKWWNDHAEWGFLRQACDACLERDSPISETLVAALRGLRALADSRLADDSISWRDILRLSAALEGSDDPASAEASARLSAELLARGLRICLAARMRYCQEAL